VVIPIVYSDKFYKEVLDPSLDDINKLSTHSPCMLRVEADERSILRRYPGRRHMLSFRKSRLDFQGETTDPRDPHPRVRPPFQLPPSRTVSHRAILTPALTHATTVSSRPTAPNPSVPPSSPLPSMPPSNLHPHLHPYHPPKRPIAGGHSPLIRREKVCGERWRTSRWGTRGPSGSTSAWDSSPVRREYFKE